MRTFNTILFIIMIFVVHGLLMVGSTVTHEMIHQTIYESYDIPSRVEYYWNVLYDFRKWDDDLDIARTIPIVDTCSTPYCCPTEYCRMQHNAVELEEYLVQSIMALSLISWLLFVIYKSFKRMDNELDKLEDEIANQRWIEVY